MLEITVYGCTNTRMHYSKDARAMKKISHPSFFPYYPFSLFFFLPLHFFPHQLITINHGLHLRLIQTLCLHLSRFTPLRKTLTVDHYLCIEYFQHSKDRGKRVIICDGFIVQLQK